MFQNQTMDLRTAWYITCIIWLLNSFQITPTANLDNDNTSTKLTKETILQIVDPITSRRKGGSE